MHIMKTKADELALLGKPVYLEDFIEHILIDLLEEYKSEIDVVNGRDNLISFAELTEKLFNREAMIICDQPVTPNFPVTANLATRSNNNNTRGSWRLSYTPHNNNFISTPT